MGSKFELALLSGGSRSRFGGSRAGKRPSSLCNLAMSSWRRPTCPNETVVRILAHFPRFCIGPRCNLDIGSLAWLMLRFEKVASCLDIALSSRLGRVLMTRDARTGLLGMNEINNNDTCKKRRGDGMGNPQRYREAQQHSREEVYLLIDNLDLVLLRGWTAVDGLQQQTNPTSLIAGTSGRGASKACLKPPFWTQ